MAKVEIHVPNKSYEGYFGGVRFHKGVGVFTDVELAKDLAEQFQYELVEVTGDATEAVAEIEDKEVAEAKPKRTRKKAEPKAGE